MYEGEPILAVAAVDELTAAEAIEQIQIEFEPLPFVVDPLVSLRPDGPNARTQGNVWMRPPASAARKGAAIRRRRGSGCRALRRPRPRQRCRSSHGGGGSGWQHRSRGAAARRPQPRKHRRTAAAAAAAAPAAPPRPEVREFKWTADDFAPRQKARCRWASRPTNGRSATSRPDSRRPPSSLDETFVSQSTSHQPLETRSAMAYWQNGKLLSPRLDAEHRADRRLVVALDSVSKPRTSSSSASTPAAASAARFPGAISMAIPALMSKKVERARCMMRITREEEHYIGRARQGLHSRVKVGLPQGRPHHGDRSVHRRRQRSIRRARRLPRRPATRSRSAISRWRCGGAA